MKWNCVLNKNSIEAGIYVMWERQMMKNAQSHFIPASVKSLISMQLTKIISIIQKPEGYFENDAIQKRDLFLKESFEQALLDLKKKLGNEISNWKYGQTNYKHIKLTHQLSSMAGDLMRAQINLGSMPRGGNNYTPGSTGGTDNQMSGASFRILIDTKDWDNTFMINSPGQSGDPESPYYKNLFAKWADDGYFPSYYSKTKILGATDEMLEMLPVR